MTEVIPVASVAAVIAALLLTTISPTARLRSWWVPAGLCAGFAALTAYAIAVDGLFGFWAVHVENFWGNQVWIDLLLAISIAWFALIDEIKRQGMHPLPWLLLVCCSGCIGMLAMVARLNYLRENAVKPQASIGATIP